MTTMRDPWNPTLEEIIAWARTPDAFEPDQDWDLALAREPHIQTYLDLAADDSCPNRQYFLRILYLIVGDAVRSGFSTMSIDALSQAIALANAHNHPDVRLWQARSLTLIQQPELFDYDSWCAGKLSRDSNSWPEP